MSRVTDSVKEAGARPRKLSRLTAISYGAGASADGIKSTAYGTFLLFFYQQLLGVPGTLVGLALGLSIIVDAITDPLVGQLSDRTSTRYGRRHPYLALAAVPLAVTFFFLFNPPKGLSDFGYFTWLLFFAVSARIALTLYDIPHLALGAEMAPSYEQRTGLFAVSSGFRVVVGALTTFLAYKFLFPTTDLYDPGLLNPDGYFWLGLVSGIMMFLAMAVCFFGTLNIVPLLRKTEGALNVNLISIFGEMFRLSKSPSFRAVFFGLFIYVMAVNMDQSYSAYIGLHFWNLTTESMAYMPLASLGGAITALVVVRPLAKLLDKKRLLIATTLLSVVNLNIFICGRLFFPNLFPANGDSIIVWMVGLNYFLVGFIGLTILTTINSMYADLADEHELLTGNRREATLYATRSFANKGAAAIGVTLSGIALEMISFPEAAKVGAVSEGVVWNLGLLYGPIISIVWLLTVWLYSKYRIDRKSHQDICDQIAARTQGVGAKA
ncbi:MFS transporter [Hyphomonas sp. CY54-11-8]|uniref:MFS transporter n=1 Tax=Hyphomonas sp. CY54-11-8 TaxID=1280944 RepID=UPI000458F451|nr:MFS transporter [Hyphomonas sp. CY54-11-8]KCZ48121.1 hypothetical protein HY17_17680 [Hyphomonas sp. CY54-11-8]